jgi:hypothetical protein
MSTSRIAARGSVRFSTGLDAGAAEAFDTAKVGEEPMREDLPRGSLPRSIAGQ